MSVDDPMAVFEDELHRESIDALARDGDVESSLPDPIDFDELYKRESHAEWLVEDLWPVGRQLHIFAARKSKKSLVMLWIVGNLAAGRDPFTGQDRDPVNVTYLDHEMTEDDLLERLESMGFTPDDLRDHLRYYLLPSMPPLDTEAGGRRLLQLVQRDESRAVVVDTLSRVVKGEENSNDTYQDFYAYTGRPLKREGIALARLDHEGHEGGRSRGASSKADDVDVAWRLRPTEVGLQFVRFATRINWVGETLDLTQRDEPHLSFSSGLRSWPAGTKAKAAELDSVHAPIDVSRRAARRLLTDAGIIAGPNDVIGKAIAYRKSRPFGATDHSTDHS